MKYENLRDMQCAKYKLNSENHSLWNLRGYCKREYEMATKVTNKMIGAAHDICLKKGDFVLSADLLERIYLAMDALANRAETSGSLTAERDRLAAELDKATDRIDKLEWENKGIAEWRDEALRFMESNKRLRDVLESFAYASFAVKSVSDYQADARAALKQARAALKEKS